MNHEWTIKHLLGHRSQPLCEHEAKPLEHSRYDRRVFSVSILRWQPDLFVTLLKVWHSSSARHEKSPRSVWMSKQLAWKCLEFSTGWKALCWLCPGRSEVPRILAKVWTQATWTPQSSCVEASAQPENQWLEDVFPTEMDMLVFRGRSIPSLWMLKQYFCAHFLKKTRVLQLLLLSESI